MTSLALGPLQVWVGRDPGNALKLGTLLDDGCTNASGVTARTNLHPDPRYVGLDGITGGSGWQQTDVTSSGGAMAPDGRGFTRFTATSDVSQGIQVGTDELVPVTAGTTYTGSVHARFFKPGVLATTRLSWRDSAGALVSNSSGSPVTNTQNAWGRYSMTATAPAGAVSVMVLLLIPAPASPELGMLSGDSFDVTMRMLEASPTLGAYFDGDTPSTFDFQYTWTGPANASPSVATAGASATMSVNEGLAVSWGRDDPVSHPDAGSLAFTVDITDPDPDAIDLFRVGQSVELKQGVWSTAPYWANGGDYTTAQVGTGDTYGYGVVYQDDTGSTGGARINVASGGADPNQKAIRLGVGPGGTPGAIARAYLTPRWTGDDQSNPSPTVSVGDTVEYRLKVSTHPTANAGVGMGILTPGGALNAVQWIRPVNTESDEWVWVEGGFTVPQAGTLVVLLQIDAPSEAAWRYTRLQQVRVIVNGATSEKVPGTETVASVFVGNITDAKATRQPAFPTDVTRVDITASEWLTRFARIPYATTPRNSETVPVRLRAVRTGITYPDSWLFQGYTGPAMDTVRPVLAGLWDIDNQPALDVMRDVATSGPFTIWPVSRIPTNAAFDDPALLYLYVETVPERYSGTTEGHGAVLDTCVVDFDIEWGQTAGDFITAMQVGWKDEVTDSSGDPALSDKTELVVRSARETEMVGRNAATVSTWVSAYTDAATVGDTWLDYVGALKWRLRSVRFPTDHVTDDDNGTALLFGLLDTQTRRAFRLAFQGAPTWLPGPRRYIYGLVLEGLSMTYTGQWFFDITVAYRGAANDD